MGRTDTDKRYPGYLKEYVWQQKARKVSRLIVELVAVVALALFCAVYFCRMASVPDSAMEGTLSNGDKVLLNSASYILGEPKRGDIIAFRTADDSNATVIFRRVIAGPGETVQIREGSVYVNGSPIHETGDYESIVNPGIAEDPITLSGNEYFVLGDNRNNAEDSRHPGIGLVNKSAVLGKAWLRIRPFSSFGTVH